MAQLSPRRQKRHDFLLVVLAERKKQKKKRGKNFLVAIARYICRPWGATLRSKAALLLGFSLVIMAYSCSSDAVHPTQCNYIVEVYFLNNQKDTVSYYTDCSYYPYIIEHNHNNDLCINSWDCFAIGVKAFKILSKNTLK